MVSTGGSAMASEDLLSALKDACNATIKRRNEFWILAALTDSSYEEGVRNVHFARCVKAYADAGVPSTLIQQLQLGINGNLRDFLQDELPAGFSVKRNQGRGQDLIVYDEAERDCARVESKPLFDLTLDKHYVTTATDYDKLSAVRGSGYEGALFLVVFFIQLPNYCYGPGRWYGRSYPRRDTYPGTWGIDRQYERLRRSLAVDPCWPAELPYRLPLIWRDGFADLTKWFAALYQPDPGWSFQRSCLEDASVGVAVWECP